MVTNMHQLIAAHACSEISLKWFLFAFHDLRKVLGFVSVLDFFGATIFLSTDRNVQNGIMAIFDHFRNKHARDFGFQVYGAKQPLYGN